MAAAAKRTRAPAAIVVLIGMARGMQRGVRAVPVVDALVSG